MSQKHSEAYAADTTEFFQINDQELTILPSDIAAFSDNAVFEETFVRSKAVFAFRSKYSRGKVILTLPISISAFAEYDSGSKASQEEGLTVLNQLTNFPYCFIKSSRIRSYISSRAKISSTDFMIFGVDEVNTVHDLRVPDVLFAEIHLVYCDHTSQMKDFKFYHNEGSPGVDYPDDSGTFVSAFSFDGYKRYAASLGMIRDVMSTMSSDNIAYSDLTEPLGAVSILAPNVLGKNEENEDGFEEDLKKIKELGFYKEVTVSSPDGQDAFTAEFFRDSAKTVDQTVEEKEESFKDAKQTMHVYWTNFYDMSFGGSSAIKSIKVSRKNKLAQLFIGSHKYPFLQYMGKYPARIEMGMEFINTGLYENGSTGTVSAIQQMNNVLDYNNEFYPEISAFNVLKIQSVSSILMGVENIVPNQTFISASADNQGVETVTVNFVEADMEDFMELGNKFEGRPAQRLDTINSTETVAVLAYLNAIKGNANVRKTIEDSPDRTLHYEAITSIRKMSEGIKSEFFGEANVQQVKEKYLAEKVPVPSNNQVPKLPEANGAIRDRELAAIDNAGKNIPGYQSLSLAKENNEAIVKLIDYKSRESGWPDKTLGISASYDGNDIQALIAIIEQRQKLITATVTNAGKEYDDATRVTSGLSYSLSKDRDGNAIIFDASETYSRSGATDVFVRQAYQILVSLKNKGDSVAVSVLPETAVDGDYLINRINSYAGTNIKDLPFAELSNPNTDPFFFLKTVPYFSEKDVHSIHNTISSEVNSAAETIVTKITGEEKDSSTFGSSNYFSIFSQSGITSEEMYITESSDDNQVYSPSGSVVDPGNYSGTYAGMATGSDKNGSSTKYDTLILDAAKRHGVDAGWIKAVMHVESHFNPNAGSPAGAKGLMQLIPKWHPGYTNYFDPYQNIDGGTKFLARLIKKYNGNMTNVLAAYNAGEANVADGSAFRKTETINYLQRVPEKYNTLYKAGLDSNPASASYKPVENSATKSANEVAKAASGGANSTVFDPAKYTKLSYSDIDQTKQNDGDTIRMKNGTKYRTRFYDTPETSHPSSKPYGSVPVAYETSGQSYGENSKNKLFQLLKNGFYVEKTLVTDPFYPDRYLTSIYTVDGQQNVAEIMMQTGHALIYSGDSAGGTAFVNNLKKIEAEARRKQIGLWGSRSLDSQDAATYKKKTRLLEEALKAAKDEKDVLAAFKANGSIIKGPSYTVNGKTYDSKTHKLLSAGTDTKTADKKAPNAATQEPRQTLGTTNTDVHFKGATTKSVTSQWGLRQLPDEKAPRLHAGIDSTGGESQEVIAAANGVLTHTWMTGGGHTAVINHQNGFVTKYLHLSKFLVNNNTSVKTGDVIGLKGSSGTTQHHLHQETHVQPIQGGMLNVSPWKTTSLKLLTGLNGKEVQAKIDSYIDSTHLLSMHPSQFGKSVLNDSNAAKKVWRGSGSAGNNNPAGLLAGLPFAPQTYNNDGKMENAYSYKKASVSAKREVPPKASVFYEQGAVDVQARNMTYYQRYGMNIGLPAIKLYVTIGNEAEDAKLLKELLPNYYFEIDGIKDLMLVCNNDESPVDFLFFKIANASFVRTDNYAVAGKFLTRDLSKVGTAGEVGFVADRVKLKPGTQLHIRAGYGNNPNLLRTIFNGCITELGNENGVCLDVVAEGYGRELLLDPISPHKPTTPGNYFTNNSTPLVISTALGNREGIGHFGNRVNFWSVLGSVVSSVPLVPGDIKGHDYSDPETKRLTTKYFDTEFRPGNYRQRMFTNIYAAEVEEKHQNFNSTWWNFVGNLFSFTEQSGYYYIMHGQTPWAVMKEMEYRHPGTLAKPLFFEDRMTMFYGFKEQMYIARDLDSSFMAKVAVHDDTTMKEEYIQHRALRFDTVCNLHIISSELNMIQNNIKLNATYSSCANVIYFEDKEDIVQKYENDDLKEFKIKMDDNLAQWEHRYKPLEMPGIHGKYSAFMYGTTELRRQAETMYSGSITVVGNPCIKAGDFAYFSDNQRRFNGLIKIRECRHYFDENRGYITEVTPGLFVEAANFIYSALFLKLSFTARTLLALTSLSAQIVANAGADFQQYMEYFKAIKPFVKRESGVSGWLNMAWTETAGVPLLGVGLTGLSAYGAARLVTNVSNATMAKLAAKGIWNSKDSASLLSAFKDLKTIGLKSATAGSMLGHSKTMLSSMQGASKLGKLGFAAAAFGSATGAASWWTATRALKSIMAIANVLMLSNPLGWVLRIAGQIAFSFVMAKIQEAELTRQPLTMFPILYNGRPYVAGITGYNYNSYLDSLKQNFNENWRKVSTAGAVMQATSSNSMVKAVGSVLANSDALGISQSYNEKKLEKLSKLESMSYKSLNNNTSKGEK